MKYLFFLLTINFLSCKQPQEDQLKKYSYFLYGTNKTGQEFAGTCFFIRKGDSLFICTVNHIACGCDNNRMKNNNLPDKMQVYLPECPKPLNIDISKTRQNCDCNAPDYFVDTVSSYYHQYIKYSIEKFITPFSKDKAVESIVLFGYHPEEVDKKINLPQEIKKSIIKKDILVRTPLGRDGKPDRSQFSFTFPKEDVNMDLEGFSGCPTFIKYEDDSTYKFFGVFSSKNEIGTDGKRILVTLPHYILTRINWAWDKDK